MVKEYTAVRVSKVPYPDVESFVLREGMELENGRFVTIGELINSEYDCYYAEETIDTDNVLFHMSHPLVNGYRYRNESEFIGRAGKALRGYRLAKGDQVTVTFDAFEEEIKEPLDADALSNPAKFYGAGTYGKLAAGATFNKGLGLVPIANEVVEGRPAIRLQVIETKVTP